MASKILSVCGCSLTDYLYTHSDFKSPEVQPLLSKENMKYDNVRRKNK